MSTSSSSSSAPSRRRPTRSRRGLAVAAALAAVAGAGAACGGSPPEPPVVMLEPSAQDAAVQRARTEAVLDQRSGPADAPVAGPPVAGPPVIAGEAGDVCDLVDDPEVVEDLARWRDYLPALGALPLDDEVRQVVAGLDGDEDAVPTRIGAMDAVWDVVEEHCGVEAERRRCRSLLMYGLADPFGLGAAGGDPAEVEAAFDIAIANLEAIREHSGDPALHHAIDAHVTVTIGARRAFESVGWGPEGLAVMEDIEAEILRLDDPEVMGPLLALETGCGFHDTAP